MNTKENRTVRGQNASKEASVGKKAEAARLEKKSIRAEAASVNSDGKTPKKPLTKKALILIISASVLILAGVIALAVYLLSDAPPTREVFRFGDYKYVILEDGTVEIAEYVGTQTEIELPFAIEGRSVSSIGESAFIDTDVVKIKLGGFTKRVGDMAFYACEKLESFDGGDSLEYIGNQAFSDCTVLETVTLPETLTYIGDYAFKHAAVTGITLPLGVTELGEGVFFGCEKLSLANLQHLEKIGKWAFYKTALKTLTLDSVKKIGKEAFSEASALEEITLGEKLTELGEFAFFGSPCVKSVEVSAQNEKYAVMNGALIDIENEELLYVPPLYAEAVLQVPFFVKTVSDSAFEGSTSVSEVILPEGLEKIGTRAFFGAVGIFRINVPESVTEIGGVAFYGTQWYENLTNEFTLVGDSILIKYTPQREDGQLVETEYAEVLYGESEIPIGVSLTLPSGIKRISSAFAYANDLISVSFPEGRIVLEDGAFYRCGFLRSVDMSAAEITLGANTFEYCQSLTSVSLPRNLTEIPAYTFRGCAALTELT